VLVICQTLAFLDVTDVYFFCVIAQWAHQKILYSNPVQMSMYEVMSSDEVKIGSKDTPR